MISFVLTLLALFLFIAGLKSVGSLKRLGEPTSSERNDPLYSPVTLLFSTAPRSKNFRAAQRRTIWLFCGASLLLFLARAAL